MAASGIGDNAPGRTLGIATTLLARAAALLGVCLGLGFAGCRCGPDPGALRRGPAADPAPAGADDSELPSERQQTPWPSLPTDRGALDELLGRYAERDGGAGAPVSTDAQHAAEAMLAAVRAGARMGAAVSGWDAIVAEIDQRFEGASRAGRPSYLLWGVYHDSVEQLTAFRQLVGPQGIGGNLAIVVELFEGVGRWTGTAEADQQGDSSLITRYLTSGDEQALDTLAVRQQDVDYAAWKYGYIPSVIELLPEARASSRPVIGCNMPLGLQLRARPVLGERTEELRELHCALVIRDALESAHQPERVAMLWGQAHLGPARFERYLPPEAQIVSILVFGGRANDLSLEALLAPSLALADPLLLGLSEPGGEAAERLALLLPVGRLGLQMERVRSSSGCPLPDDLQHRLRLSSSERATVLIDGKNELELKSEPRSVRLEPGPHTYWVESRSLAISGAIDMPESGALELELQPSSRGVLYTEVDCSSAHALALPEY